MIKLGLISALTLIIFFTVGFFSGYQQAADFYVAGSEIEPLTLPVKTGLLEKDIEPQLPDSILAGAEIDVDQPQVTASIRDGNISIEAKKLTSSATQSSNKIKIDSAKTHKAVILTTPVSIQQTDKLDNDRNSVGAHIAEVVSLLPAEEKTISHGVQDKLTVPLSINKTGRVEVAELTPVELNNVKYSIQAGMYGNLLNAENMVQILQAKDLDAYVSDYLNKQNETRYNARFGFFADKKTALAALKKYKEKQQGDGYLVNFSVDSIVNLADAKGLKPFTAVEKIEKEPSSELTPTEANQGSGSPVDFIKTTNFLAKVQAQEQSLTK